jgi:hypothetical protein
MSNSIPEDQLDSRHVDLLAAQRFLYAQAKELVGLQIILTVPVAIIWGILVAFLPELKAWAAFSSLAVAILDAAVLDALETRLKLKAAKIRELFDCEVLDLQWRDFKVGRRPDPEDIEEAARRFKRKHGDVEKLKNWYPASVGQPPLHLGRVVCQRSNVWWRSKLHERYAVSVIVGLSILAVLMFAIGLVGGMSLEKFVLAVLAPLSPAVLWGIRDCKKQMKASTRSRRLKEHAEDLWEKSLKGDLPVEEIDRESRELQDELFVSRRDDPLIFDWVYERLRDEFEAQMNKGAEELAAEALKRYQA